MTPGVRLFSCAARRIRWPPVKGTPMRIGEKSFVSFGARLVLPLLVVAGFAAWMTLPEPSDAEDQSAPPPSALLSSTQRTSSPDAVIAQPPVTTPAAVQAAAPADAASTGAIEATPQTSLMEPKPEKSPLEGLRISSQSWRRGGLGSKALVTLTLRNANEFAVKDIEIACAFSRRDGSHLTERKRVISDTVSMKSRKTYAHMLVGFVNINANKAKCSLITASRI
jgi:hypothetical protein